MNCAKTFPTPDSGQDWRATAPDSSSKPFAWFNNSDPELYAWRTWQRCFLEGWTEYLDRWPRSGLMLNGIVYRLPPLVRRISGTGCLSSGVSSGHQAEFPTPTASTYGSSGNGTGNNTVSRGRPSLESMAKNNTWYVPTPSATDGRRGAESLEAKRRRGAHTGVTLNDYVEKFPTPTASDHKGSGPSMVRKDGKVRGDRLDYAVERNSDGTPTGGQLNPTWVEWLMGFPSEWTVLEDSETP